MAKKENETIEKEEIYTEQTINKTNNPEEKLESTIPKKEFKKFQAGDMIPCRCVRPNKVIYYSTKTDSRYEWNGYGDIEEVDYADLLKWKTSKDSYLYEPKVVIEDSDLYEQWKNLLEPIYKNFMGLEDPKTLFNMSDSKFEQKLKTAPSTFQEIIKVTASRMLKEKTLNQISKINIIDKVLKTCLKDFL